MSGLHSVSIPVDMLEEFEYLSDAEAGAVIKKYLKYAIDGIEPELSGVIGCVFRALRRELTRMNDIRAKRSEAGRKGGRGHKKAEPVNTQEGAEQLAMALDEPPQAKQGAIAEQCKQMFSSVEATPPTPETKPMQTAFIDDDEAYQIQQKNNEVKYEAERNGFNITASVMDNLSELVAQNGASAVIEAIRIAGDAGASNMRYLKGVLKGQARDRDRKKREDSMIDNPMLLEKYAGQRLVFTPCG